MRSNHVPIEQRANGDCAVTHNACGICIYLTLVRVARPDTLLKLQAVMPPIKVAEQKRIGCWPRASEVQASCALSQKSSTALWICSEAAFHGEPAIVPTRSLQPNASDARASRAARGARAAANAAASAAVLHARCAVPTAAAAAAAADVVCVVAQSRREAPHVPRLNLGWGAWEVRPVPVSSIASLHRL